MNAMPALRAISEIRLVNGSTGDPSLLIDYPGRDDAFLFDAGENGSLSLKRLGDLQAVFITHHHIDHFVGFDRILRANLDHDKTLQIFGPEGTIRRLYARIASYEYQYFPFMKIVFEVHDVHADRVCSARLECTRHFPEPEVLECERNGPVIYENADLQIEVAAGDHVVPCLAYVLVEKAGYHADPAKLATGRLRAAPGWDKLWNSCEREPARCDRESGRRQLSSGRPGGTVLHHLAAPGWLM